MKQKRTKPKLRNQKVYHISDTMTIHDKMGFVLIERSKALPGQITFKVPSSIDGNRLTQIKQDFENEINKFRARGGQSETQ